MRTGVIVDVSPADRERLAAIVVDRNSPQKHAWRARIVLLSSEGCGTAEIMREAGVAKTAVWRWQERFMQEGVDGLLRDKTRPSRIPSLAPEVAGRSAGTSHLPALQDAAHANNRQSVLALDDRAHIITAGADSYRFRRTTAQRKRQRRNKRN